LAQLVRINSNGYMGKAERMNVENNGYAISSQFHWYYQWWARQQVLPQKSENENENLILVFPWAHTWPVNHEVEKGKLRINRRKSINSGIILHLIPFTPARQLFYFSFSKSSFYWLKLQRLFIPANPMRSSCLLPSSFAGILDLRFGCNQLKIQLALGLYTTLDGWGITQNRIRNRPQRRAVLSNRPPIQN